MATPPTTLPPRRHSVKSTCAIGVLPRWAMPGFSVDYRSWPFLFVAASDKQDGAEAMWTSTTQSELREIVWLASVVSALSILGTGIAVALAMVLVV
jgi:hypothetical protein